MRKVIFLFLSVCSLGQTLRDCRLVYVEPMPENLDRFVSAEIVKWGGMRVVTAEDKATCIAAFGRQKTRIDIKSDSGSLNVPKGEAEVSEEIARQELPKGNLGRTAALEIVHRERGPLLQAKVSIRASGCMVNPEGIAGLEGFGRGNG